MIEFAIADLHIAATTDTTPWVEFERLGVDAQSLTFFTHGTSPTDVAAKATLADAIRLYEREPE